MKLLDKIKNFFGHNKDDQQSLNSQQFVLVRYRDEHMMSYYYFWVSSNQTLVSPAFTSAADAEQWLNEYEQTSIAQKIIAGDEYYV